MFDFLVVNDSVEKAYSTLKSILAKASPLMIPIKGNVFYAVLFPPTGDRGFSAEEKIV